MEYTEDDLTRGLIQLYQDRDFNQIIEPEAHFNHYGNKGWPDLYAVFERPTERLIEHHIIEVNSESAVKSATGANQIVRQFKTMLKYFFKDEQNIADIPTNDWEMVFVFELTFIPTEYNILHIFDNIQIYHEVFKSGKMDPFEELPSDQTNRGIHQGVEKSMTLRHPNSPEREWQLASNEGLRSVMDKDASSFLDTLREKESWSL